MRTLILTSVVLAATLAASTAQAGIFGWRNRGPAVQAAPVAAASATVTTARTENGYRSFSYQPAPVYAAPAYGFQVGSPAAGSGFHDAGWKIRGF
jgi:hypothetical protein